MNPLAWSQAAGIFRYETALMLRSKGRWVVYGLLYVLYIGLFYAVERSGRSLRVPEPEAWLQAGRSIFQFNVFMGLLAGINAADCLDRDRRAGMTELQQSSPLSRWTYVLGKYAGALVAALVPYLLWVVLYGSVELGLGLASLRHALSLLAAFAAIAVPGYAFVVAFSVACPVVMPIRVYQILFTGYWFWGNYLNPKLLPTLNGTLLTPSGVFATDAFFTGAVPGPRHGQHYTVTEAWLNLAVLAGCIVIVMVSLERLLAWRARRA